MKREWIDAVGPWTPMARWKRLTLQGLWRGLPLMVVFTLFRGWGWWIVLFALGGRMLVEAMGLMGYLLWARRFEPWMDATGLHNRISRSYSWGEMQNLRLEKETIEFDVASQTLALRPQTGDPWHLLARMQDLQRQDPGTPDGVPAAFQPIRGPGMMEARSTARAFSREMRDSRESGFRLYDGPPIAEARWLEPSLESVFLGYR